jgi:acid stress chaperone HdeB
MKKVLSMIIATTLLATAASAMAVETQSSAKKVVETTPENMTCEEFIDLNPKSYTPVAFWVLNDDTQYKHGDTVDFHEIDVAVTPKLIEACKQAPKSKLGEIKDFFKKHF